MNFYQENHYSSNHDEETGRSMLGNLPNPSPTNDYDPEYDSQIANLLDELDEEPDETVADKKKEHDEAENLKREQYEDYYDDFSEEDEVEEPPPWYDVIMQKKIKMTKQRLTDLSKIACYTSVVAREQIIRMEQDHNTPFCKFDYPRYPSLSKDWTNFWKFNCVIKCKVDPPEPEHAHTQECEFISLEHDTSLVSTRTKHILACEFPDYVMNAVEAFQDFINLTSKNSSYIQKDEVPDTVYEKPTWSFIKLRSNYKKELLLLAKGKGLTPIIRSFKNWFDSGAGRSTNIVSVWCENVKWSQKKGQFPPSFIAGDLELRDKIGPIILKYSAKTSMNFNSIDVKLLAKTLLEYLSLTKETTVLDIGCNIGVLTLILAQKCQKAIGFYNVESDIRLADEIKNRNNINNATFLNCKPNEIYNKCLPFLIGCVSVAVVHLAPPYGKTSDAMRALRNCPTVWRVAVYGKITNEYHKHLTVLTNHDVGRDEMGEEFLPMRCCILDKAPIADPHNDKEAFDIVILFERKSLIETKVNLISSGPTVNLKVEEYNIPEEVKRNILKVEKGFGDLPPTKSYRPFLPKVLRPCKKFGKFDSPLLPKDFKGENKLQKDFESRIPTPPPELLDDDDSQPYVPLPVKLKMKEKGLIEHLPISTTYDKKVDMDHTISKRSNRYDCPSPPRRTNRTDSSSPSRRTRQMGSSSPCRRTSRRDSPSPHRRPSRNESPSPHRRASRRDSPSTYRKTTRNGSWSPYRRTSHRDSPSPRRRTARNESPSPHRRPNRRDSPSQHPRSISTNNVSVKTERHSESPGNKKYFKSQILSEEENKLISLKEEKNSDNLANNPVKLVKNNFSRVVLSTHRKRQETEKEEGEISNESNESSPHSSPLRVNIKNEPIDPTETLENTSSNIVNNVVVKPEKETSDNSSMSQIIKIKQEPIDDSTSLHTETEPVKIKSEPLYSEAADMSDFETMTTPVHNPAALAERKPIAVSPTNFTIDGQAFTVNPNESFLDVKQEPQDSEQTHELQELQELLEPEVAEPESVVEQKPIVKIKLEKNYAEQHDNLKSSSSDEVCIIKEKRKLPFKKERLFKAVREEADLRNLLERQRALQKQLAQSDLAVKRERSSSCEELTYSSSSERRYRPAPKTFSPRTRIVPSKLLKGKMSRSRSPSPNYRSRSPYSKKYYNRSSYSYRYRGRSPSRRSKSPLSPRTSVRRSRSPNSPVYRSRSPNSPVYRSRSPNRAFKRKSRSPFSAVKRRTRSPAKLGFRSSPIGDISKHSKNKWSPMRSNWGRKLRSRSMSPKRIKRETESPSSRRASWRSSETSLSLSPSPPLYQRKSYYDRKKDKKDKKDRKEHKKDKKDKKKRKSKTPDIPSSLKEAPKSESSSTKIEDLWDIPRLSHLGNGNSEKSENVKLSPVSNSSNLAGADEKEAT